MLLKTILKDEFRLLTFRTPSAGIREHPGAYLAFGLVLTWATGVGRYWDSAEAMLWQHLGLGSLVYVFLLALVLWLLVAPLRPRNWSYRNILLFITLTSPPALFYAIPVEIFVSSSTALTINAVFLAVVAFWRVALLFVFLNRVAGLGGFTIVVAALLPLALIVDGLTFLNLEHLVYETMVGLRDPEGVQPKAAFTIVQAISTLSVLVTPVLLALYAWIAGGRRPNREAGAVTADDRFGVPKGGERLRMNIPNVHSREDLDFAVRTLRMARASVAPNATPPN